MDYQAAMLQRKANGDTTIDLMADVLEGDSREEIEDNFEYERKPHHVGYIYLNGRRWGFGEEVIVEQA